MPFLTALAQLKGWVEDEAVSFCCKNYLTESARPNLPEHLRALENILGAQKGGEELQKDLEKNREKIASRREKILRCEKFIKATCCTIMALDILIFKPLPMETIHKMMTEFLVRDDMKRMRVTAKEMNKIGSMVEEVIIQKEILKDHKREIENLEQSSVHLHVIAKKRGWDLPKQRAANSA